MNPSTAKFRNWITSMDAYTFKMPVRFRLALAALPLALLTGGCFSSHSGSIKVTVGNATFLPELSTKDGSLHLRLLESINGAVIYAPSNSCTKIDYSNTSKTSYFGIVESEDSKSLSTTISIPTDSENQKTGDDININTKKHNANEEKVTADAPITKRCDGRFLLKRHSNLLAHIIRHNYIIVSLLTHSDPPVSKRHISSPARNKTQNITTPLNSRDSRYVTSPDMRSNQTAGFRAFPSRLLCRDRMSCTTHEHDNLLMSVS